MRLACIEAVQADQREHVRHARGDGRARHALPAQAEGDIGGDVQVGKQGVGLEHCVDRTPVRRLRAEVGAVQRDAAGVRADEAGDRAQQGRLAGAGAAEQHEQFSPVHVQIEAVEGRGRVEPHGQAAHAQQRPGRWQRRYWPALKRAHIRVRARSAACGTALVVKNCFCTSAGG